MTHRILGSILVFFSIIFLPYWVYLPLIIIAIIAFPFFWEGIFLAFLIDILYGNGVETAFYALILLVLLIPIREHLRFR